MRGRHSYIEQVTRLEKAMKHELAQRAAEEARLLKRYDLDKLDLEAEYAKIQRKESYLSAKRRAVVCEIVEARKFNSEVNNILDFDIEMRAAHGVPGGGVLRDTPDGGKEIVLHDVKGAEA